jgi:hypothetical protein
MCLPSLAVAKHRRATSSPSATAPVAEQRCRRFMRPPRVRHPQHAQQHQQQHQVPPLPPPLRPRHRPRWCFSRARAQHRCSHSRAISQPFLPRAPPFAPSLARLAPSPTSLNPVLTSLEAGWKLTGSPALTSLAPRHPRHRPWQLAGSRLAAGRKLTGRSAPPSLHRDVVTQPHAPCPHLSGSCA